jgi:hypothetical protein
MDMSRYLPAMAVLRAREMARRGDNRREWRKREM